MSSSVRLTVLMLFLGLLCSCAGDMTITPLPGVPATNKLRIFVLPISDTPKDQIGRPHSWGFSHTDFSSSQYRIVGSFLKERFIYDVISEEDVSKVTGNAWRARWEWSKDGWSLARRVGAALHADYILAVVRGTSGIHGTYTVDYEMHLVNVRSGSVFSAAERVSPKETITAYNVSDMRTDLTTKGRDAIRSLYRTIFNASLPDLLADALKKAAPARPSPAASVVPPRLPASAGGTTSAAVQAAPSRSAARMPEPSAEAGLPRLADTAAAPASGGPSRRNVAVNDFSAPQALQVVAAILADALREEIFKSGKYTLVTRDALVANELQLQASGIVDDRAAVEFGRWLAAQETVTGALNPIGRTLLLQVKRIDVESSKTLGMSSVKAGDDDVERLLGGIASMMQQLSF